MCPEGGARDGCHERANSPVVVMVSVLYVAGSGRSGSTVLDTLIGSHGQATTAGELYKLPRQWADPRFHCACGHLVRTCPFWMAVVDRWCALTGETGLERYEALRREIMQWRQLPPALFTRKVWRDARFTTYARLSGAMVRAVSEVAERPWVVDSSKVSLYLIALCQNADVDIKTVHLVRDVRGVCWSRLKSRFPNPVSRTAAFWLVANVATELVTRRWVGRQSTLLPSYKPASTLIWSTIRQYPA